MAGLCSQEASQPPLLHTLVILDTDWMKTVPGSSQTAQDQDQDQEAAPGSVRRVESGVALYQPVNLVRM